MVKLLELNDIINTIIQKYRLVRKGDLNGAKALPTVANTPGAVYHTAKDAPVEDSLIDLGGDEPANGSSSTPGPSNLSLLQDDLLGLSIDDPFAGSSPPRSISESSTGASLAVW